jgi:hypothetical protein
LPAADWEAFLKKYNAKLCEAYGRVQPENVEVPDKLLSSTGESEERRQLCLLVLAEAEAHG